MDQDPLLELVRRLMRKSGSLESTGAGELIDHAALTAATQDPQLVATATRAMARGPSQLTDLEFASLEAIVQVLGRPALRYPNGSVEMPPDSLGDNDRWRVVIAISRSKINAASASVGKITLGDTAQPVLQGTGWRLGPDLIVTNRHVARLLAENPNDPHSTWRMNASNHPAIDFGKPNSRFPLASSPYTSPTEEIDFAILRLSPCSSPLPPPLKLDGNSGQYPQYPISTEVYVVGHPYRAWASTDSAAVFGTADGSKRCSPGYVTSVNLDSTFEHDCSTLGGSSGSCVFATTTHRVIGLHMGGRDVDELTSRGAANRALLLSRLPARELEILKTGKV